MTYKIRDLTKEKSRANIKKRTDAQKEKLKRIAERRKYADNYIYRNRRLVELQKESYKLTARLNSIVLEINAIKRNKRLDLATNKADEYVLYEKATAADFNNDEIVVLDNIENFFY